MLFDAFEETTIINKIVAATQSLNAANVVNLRRDTWGHGDVKPENILLYKDTGHPYLIDSDMHWKPAVVDVAKMVSRILALGLGGKVPIAMLQENVSNFLKGYYEFESIPYQQIADIVALDFIVILAVCSNIDREQLQNYPEWAKRFLGNLHEAVAFIEYLTSRKQNSLSAITNFFFSLGWLRF